MGSVQFIRGTPRRSTLGGIVQALQSGIKGYQGAQDRRMSQEKESLAAMKTMAELEKLQAQVPLYQAQSKLYNAFASNPQNISQGDEEDQYEEGQEYEDDETGEKYLFQNGQLVPIS